MPMKEFVRRIFGAEDSGYRSAHARRHNEAINDRRRALPLEGAGRISWDQEQNLVYGAVYGNTPGNAGRGEERKGLFRGRGPRNYQRHDERIREDIHVKLTDDPYVDATDIEVEVHGGEVVLAGAVENRSAKRRAEDLAESVSGVKHIENRLRIK